MNFGISDFANFFGVKFLPLPPIKLPVKCLQIFNRLEIHKGVAHVAVITKINRQVEKIKFLFKVFFHFLQYHFFCVFIGNIFNHYRGSFLSIFFTDVNVVIFLLLMFLFLLLFFWQFRYTLIIFFHFLFTLN